MSYRLPSLACACLLGACASSATQTIKEVTQASAAPLIHVGISTKADVAHAFGESRIINKFGSGEEVWTYRYAGQAESKMFRHPPDITAVAKPPEKPVHELVIQFNPVGVVMKFRVHEGVDAG